MKNKYNILFLIIEIIFFISAGFITGKHYTEYRFNSSPTYTEIQPSNYFTDLNSNSVIYLSNFEVYPMLDTPSMLPTLPYNSHVLVTNNYSNLQVGDIVVIYLNITGEYSKFNSAHRIIKIKEKDREDCYITKGDNIKYHDGECWLKSEIYGKVVGVLY